MKTPLVISFSGILRLMARGAVTVSELEDAIFYFGCNESWVKDEASALSELRWCDVDEERQKEVYRQFREVMDQAEARGRVGYREEGRPNSWECLNQLLLSNGLPPINAVDTDNRYGNGTDDGMELHYAYQIVIDAVMEQELPYRVLWNS